MNIIFWMLVALVPFWLLQNIIHEVAHGLTLRFGWKWQFSIWPFPSMKLGHFTFAHVIYKPTITSLMPNNRGWALVSIMPRLVNAIFIICSSILELMCISSLRSLYLLCDLFVVCNFIDFSVGMFSIFRSQPNQSDIWRYQAYMGADVGKLRFLAIVTVLGLALVSLPVLYHLIGVMHG